jgi:hypothetical protein
MSADAPDSLRLAGNLDEIPGSMQDYLLQHLCVTGKVELNSKAPVVQFGQSRGVNGVALGGGWAHLEHWGVWTEGERATIYLRNPLLSKGTSLVLDVSGELTIDVRGAVSKFHPKLMARFLLGSSQAEFSFLWPETTSAKIKLPVPFELMTSPIIRLDFEIDSPKRASEHTDGVSPDRRRVGIGLRSIETRPPTKEELKFDGPQSRRSSPEANPDRCYREGSEDGVRKGTAKVIALTMVYNEGDSLHRWLNHYGRHLGERNILVIDDGSDDGSTDDVGVAGRLSIPRTLADDGQRAAFVSDLQRDLLRYYDAVIYTDCDEFLVPDPRLFPNLREYVNHMTVECVRPVAFNLVHIRDKEPDLEASRGLLEQRNYCQFVTPECKPVIAKVPIRWVAGFHACDKKTILDPCLLLVHAKLADFSTALARLAITRQMPWSERSIIAGWGNHSRADDETLINTFDSAERFLRNGGNAEVLRPEDLAAMINAQMDETGPPYRCSPFTGPLSRVPEWLRGEV